MQQCFNFHFAFLSRFIILVRCENKMFCASSTLNFVKTLEKKNCFASFHNAYLSICVPTMSMTLRTYCISHSASTRIIHVQYVRGVENWTESVTWIFVCFLPPTNWTLNSWWKLKKGKWKGMRESCLVYCYSGIQSLFEVVLLYTFYTRGSMFTVTTIWLGFHLFYAIIW